MKADQIEVRSIHNEDEYEQVMQILDKAFAVGRHFFHTRMSNDSAYDASTTWIVKKGDCVTSTIQVFPVHCRIGGQAVKVGGLGSVATDEAFRGQGHSQSILRGLTDWMEEEQYDLSLLYTGITPFYEKSGWNVVPQPQYQLNAEQLSALASSNPSVSYIIIPFDSSYTNDIASIYERYNHNRTNTAIRSEAYWNDLQQWPRWQANDKLIALHDGTPVAYGVISSLVNDSYCFLDELCYLDGHEAAVLPLLQQLLLTRNGLTELFAYLPDDHMLADFIMKSGGQCTMYGSVMWKVIRYLPMLAKLQEQLQQRLACSSYADKELSIKLVCAHHKAYLHYADHKLAIEAEEDKKRTYLTIELSQSLFVGALLLGINFMIEEQSGSNDPLSKQIADALSVEAREILQILFPHQASTYYNLDRF